MYNKVYLEITNNCNLNCDFCIKNTRKNKFISLDEFNIILDKLKNYTKYLYFHILGEPLLHPNINELINIANNKGFKVNITTNGYLINNIKNNINIRQLNISLHSFSFKYNKSLNDYLKDIFDVVETLKEHTYISYRLWVNTEYKDLIIDYINKYYNIKIELDSKDNYKIDKNIFLNINKEFIWPDLNNSEINLYGKCYALKKHIGILVDGTVVPCCLDSKGIIKLGNIFENDINDIKNSKRYKNMLKGFNDNKKIEDLCKHCKFIEK